MTPSEPATEEEVDTEGSEGFEMVRFRAPSDDLEEGRRIVHGEDNMTMSDLLRLGLRLAIQVYHAQQRPIRTTQGLIIKKAGEPYPPRPNPNEPLDRGRKFKS